MKIVFGEINAAAAFGNVRVAVGELAARGIKLQTGTVGEPDCRDAAEIKFSGELRETANRGALRRN